MSFSSDVKKELTTLDPGKKCCQLAQIAGMMRFAGSITLSGGGMGIKVSTTDPAVARLFINLMRTYFGAKASLFVEESARLARGRSYSLQITPDMNADAILREVGILAVREGSNYLTDGLPKDIIKKRCCKKAMLRGVFLASGSVTDPSRSYHLELKCDSPEMADDLMKLLGSFGLRPKLTERRGKQVVYIKESEQISDFLNIIGASQMYFRFQDVKITRELVNTANRINNCESANMEKTASAALRQRLDVALIAAERGLDSLPEKLRQAAVLRRDNPELSLAELAELADPPISKSGLNHRFEKLAAMAEAIRAAQ